MSLSQPAAIAIGIVGSIVAIVAVSGAVLGFVFGKKKQRCTLVDPNVKVPLRLVDRQAISPDTVRLKLALGSPVDILGLSIGNHVYFSARIDGAMVVRPYTPISLNEQKGFVDFVIKIYPQGKMTQYISKLPLQNHIDVRGPGGLLNYQGNGVFQIKPDNAGTPVKYTAKKICMICGGSGITPMFQLLSHLLPDKEDTTKLALLYANNAEKDILLRDELDQFSDRYPNQFRVWYTVKDAPPHWSYSTGYVTDTMISEHLYPPGDDTLVLLCGPPPMIELACLPNLSKLGYPRNRIFTY